ncbi:MAG TPA: VOC family protein, partial [Bacillota bacterium]
MPIETPGIHHITAVAGDPQTNIDFYTDVLGLRLVKVTVNQDDPGTYHFFYGDETARPGTDLTFFPWPGARPGVRGVGQATAVAFAVAPEALDYWVRRLAEHGVRLEEPVERFGERVLTFYDPDGLKLELVASPEADPALAWAGGPVPQEYALRGFYGVTLEVAALEPTAAVLRDL